MVPTLHIFSCCRRNHALRQAFCQMIVSGGDFNLLLMGAVPGALIQAAKASLVRLKYEYASGRQSVQTERQY